MWHLIIIASSVNCFMEHFAIPVITVEYSMVEPVTFNYPFQNCTIHFNDVKSTKGLSGMCTIQQRTRQLEVRYE